MSLFVWFGNTDFLNLRVIREEQFVYDLRWAVLLLSQTTRGYIQYFMTRLPTIIICFCFWLLANPRNAIQSQLPEGLWLSDGYGLLVELDTSELHTYELTSISCMPSRNGNRGTSVSSDRTIVFASGHSTIRIIRTDDPKTVRMHVDGDASDIILHHVTQRPDTCRHEPENSPQENYDIFWRTFAEQYPFFTLRKIDWHAIDMKFRPQVIRTTTPSQLFQIFQQMIEPLQDAHTGLDAKDLKREFDGRRSDPNHLGEEGWKRAASIIESKYVRGGLRPYCKGHLQFGMMREAIGYLRVTTFYDYAEAGGYALQLQCLQQSLDAIFGGASRLNGLVIDVRLNDGGEDPFGIEIASRLTSKQYLAYTKAARNSAGLDAPLHLTERQTAWVMPSVRPGFKGKIAELIGPDTISAGETFTMALMGREPHVMLIGVNTQGVFSDVLNRSLPNGWRFHLPNEIYFTADDRAFDAVGVPPDIRVPFFPPADLQNDRDTALESAIRELMN